MTQDLAGPGVIDVTLWRQKKSLTVHLVNFTNPMMMKGPIRETIPVGAQQVRVRLPEGVRAKAVRLLVANTTPASRMASGWLEVTVPSIRGSFKSTRNFYSRQEGQIDFTKASRLIAEPS